MRLELPNINNFKRDRTFTQMNNRVSSFLGQCVEYQALIFSSHAIQRMFSRRITQEEVRAVIACGEIIVEYPDDQPFPSYLLLDFVGNRPIHVVFSYDQETDTGYVVTAYIPDPDIWQSDFRTRK